MFQQNLILGSYDTCTAEQQSEIAPNETSQQIRCMGVGCTDSDSRIKIRRYSIKNKLKQGLLVSGAILGVGAASFGTIGLAHAATSIDTNPEQSIVEKLASKFGLNQDEVQSVFDESRSEREAEHEARIAEELAELVSEGKLTEEQVEALKTKSAEIKSEREADKDSMKDKTEDERKSIMESKRTELDQWLSDNGIDEEYGRFLMGGGRGGPGGPGGHGGPRSTSSDPSSENEGQTDTN